MILKVNQNIKKDLDGRGFSLANPNHPKTANCTIVLLDKKQYILIKENNKAFNSIAFNCKDNINFILSLIDYDETTDYRQWFVSENNKWLHNQTQKFSHIMAKWSYPTATNWRRASIKEVKKHFLTT